MDRHDSAWALRDKAVLIRNRWEGRSGRGMNVRAADLAYVARAIMILGRLCCIVHPSGGAMQGIGGYWGIKLVFGILWSSETENRHLDVSGDRCPYSFILCRFGDPRCGLCVIQNTRLL